MVSHQSLQISICNLTVLGHVCLGDKLEAGAQEVLWPSRNVCEGAWPGLSSRISNIPFATLQELWWHQSD